MVMMHTQWSLTDQGKGRNPDALAAWAGRGRRHQDGHAHLVIRTAAKIAPPRAVERREVAAHASKATAYRGGLATGELRRSNRADSPPPARRR